MAATMAVCFLLLSGLTSEEGGGDGMGRGRGEKDFMFRREISSADKVNKSGRG